MKGSAAAHGTMAGLIGLLAMLALPDGALAQAPGLSAPPPAASSAPAAGLELYVLVKKLSRIGARAETAFTPGEARKLGDLLEPLFEEPELDLQEAHTLLLTVPGSLTRAQTDALDAIQDITPQSIMPAVSPGPAPGAFGPPGGFPGGPFGGFRGGRRATQTSTSDPRFNPFYASSGGPLTEQATRDLRALLDAFDRVAPPVTARPARVTLRPEQKISVATFHYDLARTGWNANEQILTPRSVDKSRFGRWWHTLLDGQVYAAPLVVASVRVNGRTHDLVIAPTEGNSVYALEADTGAILWKQHLATPLTDDEYNDCINITPLHGITSTPVIDLDRQEIFVCGVTRAGFTQVYKVWALDLATGAVKSGWPVTLQGAYKGTPFDGGQLTQRGALTMVDGWLYLPFSSRCDIGEWHGWVMGVNARNPEARQRAFSPAPDASGGGIWGSAGLAADREGNLYAVTGNGDYTLKQGGQSVTEAIVRLTAKQDLSFTYSPADYYVPSDYELLDQVDADLGGSSALVLDHPGSATPHLLITGGKDGIAYLVNRDNLGGIGGEIQKLRLFGSDEGGYGGAIKTTPAYFEDGKGGQYVFVTGNDKGPNGTQGVVALKLDLDGRQRSQVKPVWSANRPLFQPGTAVVSSNSHADAIVWVIESNKPDEDSGPPGVLHAYDALTGRELYRSSQRERRDSLGDARKFSAPTVANGRVYCGTDGVVCYGPIKEEK
jgi:outer membrane protein assembly factor BamB